MTCLTMTERHIISGSEDGLIVKWSIATMEPVYVYRGHRSKINFVISSGECIFSSSYDRTAKAWKNYDEETDLTEDRLICTFRVKLIQFNSFIRLIYCHQNQYVSISTNFYFFRDTKRVYFQWYSFQRMAAINVTS